MHKEEHDRKEDPAASSISLTVNGQVYKTDVGSKPDQVDPAHTLAHTLRETLGLTGTKALLNEDHSPTEGEVKEALSGNFRRCISHYQVVQAVMAASGKAM